MSMDTDRLEADVNQSRTRLNDTLQQLGAKLSPGQMLDEVLGLAQGQAGEFAGKLGRQVRDNPLTTLLIGAGVAMLFANRHGHNGISHDDWHAERRYRSLEEARWNTPRNAGESDEDYDTRLHHAYGQSLDLKQKAGEAAHEFKDRISQTVDGVRERAMSARERIGQSIEGASAYVADKAHSVGERASDMKSGVQNMYQDSPLSLGAIALAVGALIGAATPLTDTEREQLEGVADKAADAGAKLAERGARMVEDQVGAVH